MRGCFFTANVRVSQRFAPRSNTHGARRRIKCLKRSGLQGFSRPSASPQAPPGPYYENSTNVTKNAADTIHMSGLMSRQWPYVTFTTTYVMKPKPMPLVMEYVNGMPMIVTNAGMAASRLPQSILPMSLIIR